MYLPIVPHSLKSFNNTVPIVFIVEGIIVVAKYVEPLFSPIANMPLAKIVNPFVKMI